MDELLAAYKSEGIDPEPYYWFTNQRKYGTLNMEGMVLGLRYVNVKWAFARYLTRNFCLFSVSLPGFLIDILTRMLYPRSVSFLGHSSLFLYLY